jgi:hypothetical protein
MGLVGVDPAGAVEIAERPIGRVVVEEPAGPFINSVASASRGRASFPKRERLASFPPPLALAKRSVGPDSSAGPCRRDLHCRHPPGRAIARRC